MAKRAKRGKAKDLDPKGRGKDVKGGGDQQRGLGRDVNRIMSRDVNRIISRDATNVIEDAAEAVRDTVNPR